MRALFLQHDHVSPPGPVADRFAHRGYEVIDRIEATTKTIGAWLLPEIEWLRETDRLGIPVLGICFGGQLLARAYGGSVARSPRPEIGWTAIWTQDAALVGPGPWFHFHYDRWQVPPEAREVARNSLASQAFVLRRNLAVQFHPEVTAATLHGWLELGGREKVEADGQDPDILYQHTLAEGEDAAHRAHALVDAFLDRIAFPVGSVEVTRPS